MALIKCAECGHDISDKAETCPSCGAPVSLSLRPVEIPPLAEKSNDGIITVKYVRADCLAGKVVFCLDGDPMYTIQPGDVFDCETTVGSHTVEVMRGEKTLGRFPVFVDGERPIVMEILVKSNKAIYRTSGEEKQEEKSVAAILQEMNEREKQKQKDKQTGAILALIFILITFLLFIYVLATDPDGLTKTFNDVFGITHQYEITMQPR